jgi:PPM family protein phosphatase
MRLDIAAQSDMGRRKKTQEDYYAVYREDTPDVRFFDEGAMLCIADGLGGHIGGEIASKLAVTTFCEHLKKLPPPEPLDGEVEADPLPYMQDWIVRANRNVWQTNQDLVKNGKPMGSTLLGVLVTPRKAFICNVGDSRCYHIRDGELLERTEDHSWVDEQVKMGLMSKAEAATDARKNYVTRCVGTHDEVESDSYKWHLVPGDWLLLCTDGLVNMLTDKEILAEFQEGGTAAEIAGKLVHLANENGGKDNITVIVANISPNPILMLFMRARAFWRKYGPSLLWILLTLLFGAICFAAGFFLHDTIQIRYF